MHPRFRAEAAPDKPACILAETGETLSYGDLNLLVVHPKGAEVSHVKCRRSVDFGREPPRHQSSMLDKRALRDRYWAHMDGRIA